MAAKGWNGSYRVIDRSNGEVYDFTAAWLATRFVFVSGMGKFNDLLVYKNGRRFRTRAGSEEEFAKALKRFGPKPKEKIAA